MLKQTNLFYLQIFLHVYIQTLKMENTLIQYQILSVKYICPKPFFSFGWLCSSRAHISQKRNINLFITNSPMGWTHTCILNFLSTPDSSKYLKGRFGKVCPTLSICFPGQKGNFIFYFWQIFKCEKCLSYTMIFLSTYYVCMCVHKETFPVRRKSIHDGHKHSHPSILPYNLHLI